ncbi:hypothetical protein EVG20_g3659 [Dentipellis fragilis]|uniref:Carboxylic ester hydrolase n=1 Tax=Dentipellis fragilis TaxID=205917 RepID=A0A4Y9Z0P1_9AGAM|nr:hypothetical protein EVG20_g3659 [Dentipellis fragilis]
MTFGTFYLLELIVASSHLCAAFASPGSANALLSDTPVVDLGYAVYAGNATTPTGQPNAPVAFFGGIPYAKAPLGDLRFRAPQELDESGHNSTVVNAMYFVPPCVQQPAASGVGSEDCLRLNVWKPANGTTDSKFPVAVYIYGGGFYAGNTEGFPLYDWVAQHPSGIIGVSISYRLNALGFLSGSAVHSDGNFNRHISKFGGDPDQITIVGESAGGASVIHQIVAYGGSRGAPFQRAIAQSIGYGSLIDPLSASAEELFANFSSAAGCSMGSKNVDLTCLRNASLDNIITGINAIQTGAIAPVLDGTFFPDYPSHLMMQGHFSEVDFIGGHCTNDGRSFASGKPSDFVTDADIIARVFPRWPYLTNPTMQKLFEFYPAVNASGSPFHTEYDLAWTMAQDAIFGCMDQLLANKMLAKGKKNVFTFRWNAPNPVLLASSPWEGVMHTSDLYFLFNGTTSAPNAGATFTPFNQSEALLSKEAIAYWTSFVATGNPSTQRRETSPEWQSFTGSGGTSRHRIVPTLEDETTTATVLEAIPEFEVERCAYWMQDWITAQTKV